MLAEIKFVFEAATKGKDLYSLVISDQVLESLDLLGDVYMSVAIRMLDESRELQGQERSSRQRSALDNLEIVYTVLDKRAELPWWRGPKAAMTRPDTYQHMANVAFVVAALRRTLGEGPRSVQVSVNNALKMFRRYEKMRQNDIESSYSYNSLYAWRVGNHTLPPQAGFRRLSAYRSIYEARLYALDSERRSANSLAAKILS